jgi:hypothetical protein
MREFAMKTLLLASATVLSLGVGSAFAATTGAAQPAATMQNRTAVSGTYAYYTPQGLMPRTEAPALPAPRPTPWGAIEAYASDTGGAAG